MAGRIAGSYGRKNDWSNFDKYIAMVDNPDSKAGAYNNIAWNLAGEGLEGEPENIEKAKKLSKKSLNAFAFSVSEVSDNPLPVFMVGILSFPLNRLLTYE